MSSTASAGKINLLLLDPLPEPVLEKLSAHFIIHPFTSLEALAPVAPHIRAVITGGGPGVASAIMAALPQLEIIAVNGVGTDAIDLNEARRRTIRVTTTSGILTNDVADMAIMLLLTLRRKLLFNERYLREGKWTHANPPLSHSLTGARLGIVGMGHIGQAIARRATAFSMEIAYISRHPKDSSYRFIPTLHDLATWADILVLAIPGGTHTANMINADILNALGPKGMLINVARGSVVDEQALLDALKENRIAGAGLDVFQHEPSINPTFFTLNNTVLQPHQASATVETRHMMGENIVNNLLAHFEGKSLLTPVI